MSEFIASSSVLEELYGESSEEKWERVRDNNSNLVAGVHALIHAQNMKLGEAKETVDNALAILGVNRYAKGVFYGLTMEDTCILLA